MTNNFVLGQGFIFGAEGSFLVSQVDGDRLRGFNDNGYSFGLIGGFSFSESHIIIVSPHYSSFGSKMKNERFTNDRESIFVENDMTTTSVLFAYSHRFGDTWEGNKRFRIRMGTSIHRLINAESNIIMSDNFEEVTIDKSRDLSSYFLTLDVGFGVNITKEIGLSINYTHGLNNLLKNHKVNIVNLSPYYLSLGIAYFFKLPTRENF